MLISQIKTGSLIAETESSYVLNLGIIDSSGKDSMLYVLVQKDNYIEILHYNYIHTDKASYSDDLDKIAIYWNEKNTIILNQE